MTGDGMEEGQWAADVRQNMAAQPEMGWRVGCWLAAQ
jgi:hypothetical protein